MRFSMDLVSTVAVTSAALVFCAWLAPEVLQRWTRPVSAVAEPRRSVQDLTGTISKAHLTNVTGTGSIAIVEFSDFECPYCGRHAQDTLPALKRDLIDSGEVRYAVVNLPLGIHPHAMRAAEAAECAADQGKYWQMHQLLFEKQKEFKGADFSEYAKSLALDLDAFDACVKNGTKRGKIQGDQEEGIRLQVNSTPTFLVGRVRPDGGVDVIRRVNGAQPLSVLKDEVAKLRQAERQANGES